MSYKPETRSARSRLETGILAGLMIVGAASSGNASVGDRLNLLPQPASVVMKSGQYCLPSTITFHVSKSGAVVAETTVRCTGTETSRRKIRFKTLSGEGWWLCTEKDALSEAPEGEEAYRLTVRPNGIALVASAEAGFRHGVRTLLQIMASGDTIPACEIDDKPALQYRGFMVYPEMFLGSGDDSRLPILDEMAAWKLNIMHINRPEGLVRFETIPGSASARAASPEAFRKLLAQAKDLGITVVPEIECWHAWWITSPHPELREAGTGSLCLTKDEVFPLLEEVIEEAASLFPGPYIHIGCDEGQYGMCDSCKAKIALVGSEQLIADYMNRVNRIVRKYGKTAIMWGDVIVRAQKGALKLLDPTMVVDDWNYWPMPPAEGLRLMREAGVPGLAAPAIAYSGASAISPTMWNMDNISNFAAHAKRLNGLGVDTTIWGAERCMPGSLGPGIAWTTDQLWNPGGRDFKGTMAAYLLQGFGLDPTPERVDRMVRLTRVGVPSGRLNRLLWSNAGELVTHERPDTQKEDEEYAASVKGIAAGFEDDLGKVKFNREAFEPLAAVAAVGEHMALRRMVAVDVVKRIRKAQADSEAGRKNAAKSELIAAAKEIRRMEADNARLLPRVRKLWAPYYGDKSIWWFSPTGYPMELAGKLDELYKKSNPDLLSNILEPRS